MSPAVAAQLRCPCPASCSKDQHVTPRLPSRIPYHGFQRIVPQAARRGREARLLLLARGAGAPGKHASKQPALEVTVEEAMVTEPIVFKADMPLREAVKVMLECDVSGAPVVDASGKLVGVLSESDVIWKGAGTPQDHYVVPPVYIGLLDAFVFLRDNKQTEQEIHKILAKTVGEAMTAPPVSIHPGATLSDAAQTMLQRKVNRLPVVDKQGHVVGVITRHDLLRGLYITSPLL